MRKRWAEVLAWLRRDAYVRSAVEAAAAGGYKEGHEAGHKAGHETGMQAGYQVGLAHGHLEGRQAMAAELEIAFGIDAARDLTADDVKRIRVSQIH